jgi:phospholipase C
MRIEEKRTVTRTELVTVAHKCDKCQTKVDGNDFPDGWHEFSAHHDEWGDDRWKNYMACSTECYALLLKDAVEEFGEYESSTIDDMPISFAARLSEHLNKIA